MAASEVTPDLQALIDSAFEIEIQRVSTLEFNSNEICRHFYGELRKRILATAPTLPGAGGGEWLPIESAPKDDCQRVLILKDCGPGSWPSVSVAYFFGGQWQLNDGHVSAESWGYRVTHWQSLPAPPAIDAATTPPPAELGRVS